MFKKKSKIILLFLVLLIAFNGFVFLNLIKFNSTAERIHETPIDFDNLRVSGPEINITTPENITYTEPMSGYYPSTYGFENDKDNDNPEDWEDLSLTNCDAQIIAEKSGHKKVLELIDNSGIESASITQTFNSAQMTGTVELWTLNTDSSTAVYILLRDSSDTTCIDVRLDTGDIVMRYNGGWIDCGPYTINTWYHIRIEFDCVSNTYNGYVNGTLMATGASYYQNDNGGGFTYLHLNTNGPQSSYSGYYDAIGYSWDNNYNAGNNIGEGLLVSFENSTNLEWQGYSLDNQADITILGNTTIPFPTDDGVHTIQVFGNNSLGTLYQSDMRYFSTELINIITPEIITYTEPMSGYYPATYGFENDKDGNNPVRWDVDELGGTVNVISSYNDHKKVVELDDTSSSENVVVTYNSAQSNGSIEFWWAIDNASETTWFGIYDSATSVCGMRIIGDILQYQNSSGWNTLGGFIPQDNKWYHFRVDFELTGDNYKGLAQYRWRFYIDGVEYGPYTLSNDQSSISKVFFQTTNNEIDYKAYVDAVGYSWDPDYSIGDNLNEGLLLSYDIGFTPDWQGYSLDGQANNTLLGNTTIPFPTDDGVHSIQVFGNNSFGKMFQSETRYFSIDTIAPTSMISFTPYNGTNEVNKSTTFSLTANDGVGSGVSVIQYKINDSSWIDYNLPFNLSSYDYGYYMIYYYSIDVVGHVEPENTLLVKLVEIPDEPDEPSEPTISGYITPLLIASICIVITFTIKKRLKSKL